MVEKGSREMLDTWKQEEGVEGKTGQEGHLELSADVHKCGTRI